VVDPAELADDPRERGGDDRLVSAASNMPSRTPEMAASVARRESR
jgi:hypothetical protein